MPDEVFVAVQKISWIAQFFFFSSDIVVGATLKKKGIIRN
jgi:hypothetical protein